MIDVQKIDVSWATFIPMSYTDNDGNCHTFQPDESLTPLELWNISIFLKECECNSYTIANKVDEMYSRMAELGIDRHFKPVNAEV